MNKLYKEESIQAIGNAIREKGGTASLLKVEEMAQAIADIPEPTGTQTVVENGTYNISSKKYVAVNVPQTGIEPQGTYTINENGFYNIRQYENVDVAVEGGRIKVNPTYRDTIIIPDAVNTGLSNPSACTLHLNDTDTSIAGIPLRHMATNDLRIDWNNSAVKNLTGEYVIENYDFTVGANIGYTNGGSYVGDGIIIHFKNCKFNKPTIGAYRSDNRRTIYTNCYFLDTMTMDYGEAHKCHIYNATGGDGIQSYGETLVKDCFVEIVDTLSETQGGNHMDGFQAWSGDNIHLDNVRIEAPWINFTYHKGSMNDAFYMEVDAPHCSLKNSIISGGGHYMIGCYKACVIDNCLLQRDSFYPASVNKTLAECTNTKITDALYVSSVIKGSNTITIYATNDTFTNRTLTVRTNVSTTTHTIPKTLQRTEYEADTKTYNDFPINIPVEISADGVEYLICYDGDTQIRFVNWSGHDVYINDTVESVKYANVSSGETKEITPSTGFDSMAKVIVTASGYNNIVAGSFNLTEDYTNDYVIHHNKHKIPNAVYLWCDNMTQQSSYSPYNRNKFRMGGIAIFDTVTGQPKNIINVTCDVNGSYLVGTGITNPLLSGATAETFTISGVLLQTGYPLAKNVPYHWVCMFDEQEE